MKRGWLIFYSLLIALPGLVGVAHFQLSDKKMKLSQHLANRYPPRVHFQYLNNLLQVNGLGSHNLGNVHMGKNSWLFYMTRSDGNANNDFWAIPTPGVVARMEDYIKKNSEHPFCMDTNYLFLSTPNKESIYPEETLYPYKGLIPKERGNYFQVYQKLQAQFPKNIVNIAPILTEKKKDDQTYHPRDTHWTDWGVYWAHQEILNKAGELLNVSFESKKIARKEPQLLEDDLNKMIKEWGSKDSQSPSSKIFLENPGKIEVPVNEETYSVHLNPQGKKYVLFIGDSFRIALKNYLPEYFQKTIFVHRNDKGAMRRALKEHGTPDLIIDQFAERYLGNKRKYECLLKD